jgi:hypothetical protein
MTCPTSASSAGSGPVRRPRTCGAQPNTGSWWPRGWSATACPGTSADGKALPPQPPPTSAILNPPGAGDPRRRHPHGTQQQLRQDGSSTCPEHSAPGPSYVSGPLPRPRGRPAGSRRVGCVCGPVRAALKTYRKFAQQAVWLLCSARSGLVLLRGTEKVQDVPETGDQALED